MPRAPNSGKCPLCGDGVDLFNRHSMRNHLRECDAEAKNSDESMAENSDADDDMFEDNVAPECEDARPSNTNCADLENYEHLNQFMRFGRVVCSEADMQLVKFIYMSCTGYGVSRNFTRAMLEYARESGGRNVHLPTSWDLCEARMTELIVELEGPRKTYTLDVAIPDAVRAMLADPSQTHIGFEFECSILELIRVAMFSETCQSWDNVALSYEDNDGHLDDFCNGERYKRIAADLSPGGAILGAVLATDGICLDKAMFDSQEVC